MTVTATRKTIRAAALPAEHGGWGFLLEPIVLGLLVAATWAGLLLSLSAFCVFLIHQPLKMMIKDRRRGLRLERTIWAERFIIGYSAAALLTFFPVLLTADPEYLIPLLLAVPLALVQFSYDLQNDSRALVPEACGAVSLASTTASLALLGGWAMRDAVLLWLLLSLRAVPSILYVRARLLAEKGKPGSPMPAWNAHWLALALVAALAAGKWVPLLAVVPFVILLGRAYKGLSKFRRPTRTAMIGMWEMIYGFSSTILIAAGYAL